MTGGCLVLLLDSQLRLLACQCLLRISKILRMTASSGFLLRPSEKKATALAQSRLLKNSMPLLVRRERLIKALLAAIARLAAAAIQRARADKLEAANRQARKAHPCS